MNSLPRRTFLKGTLASAAGAACAAVSRSARAMQAPTDANAMAAVFHVECAAKAAAAKAAGNMSVTGKNGWLFFDRELRHLSAGKFWGDDAVKANPAANPRNADPLPAILDFKAQMDKAGIELIVLPVPPKAVIHSDQLSDAVAPAAGGALPRVDPHHQAFYALLRENKINIIDLIPDYLAARNQDSPLYCKQDTHWSGAACVLTAELLAKHIQDRPWLAALKKNKYEHETRPTPIAGDLWAALKKPEIQKESVPLTFVGIKNGASLEPVGPDPKSPILLLGDSHNLVFHDGGDMHAKGAGLPDHLARVLGSPIDVVAVRGSGATPARMNLLRTSRANADYLKAKKLVIWCFSAREFTESTGWPKVPVVS